MSLSERIRDKIVSMINTYKDDITDFTEQLITFPTENPPGLHYKECAEFILSMLKKLDLDCEIIETPSLKIDGAHLNNPGYCIQSHYGAGEKTLYLHGHYDVVPADSREQFQPFIKAGKLYGRGSSDMKSGLSAMIFAVKALKDCQIELSGQICLTIVPDEETGGARGSEYLSKTGILGKNGIGMITAEPTSGVIWNASRGALSLKITVKGKPAHVGMQYQGVNAFENMLRVANALFQLKKEVESRQTKFNIQPSAARNSILMIGGRIEGGANFNLVPETCSFTIDRRINPEEDFETEKKRIFGILESLKNDGVDMDVEIIQEGYSSGISEDEDLAMKLSENIEYIKGRKPKFEICPGLLETRFYNKRGIPALAYGPGILSVSHGPDEFVKMKELYNCCAIFALTAMDILSGNND